MSKKMKELDVIKVTTSDNRDSLRRALSKQDYGRAFTKVGFNMVRVCENIDKLRDYSLRVGSKSDNKEKSTLIDSIIITTADLFNETFDLISDIKEYDYTTKNEKIENITEATELEDKCNNYQEQYERLVNKIKAQNINIIRQSYAFSSMSSYDFNEMNKTRKDPFKNGRDFLDGIENKQKQNETIDQAAFIISSSASRRNSIQNVLFGSKVDSGKGKDSFEMKIESNISKAFTTERRSFISKYLVYMIIFLVVLGIILSVILQ